MYKKILFLLYINCFFIFSAFCDESNQLIPTPTFQNSNETTNDNQKSGIKTELDMQISVQELAIAKAKRDYQNVLNTNDEKLILNTKNILILEYEKTIPFVCMPTIHKDLTYIPDKKNERCQSLINDLLELYPYSPIALCAKYGYEDTKCQEAFSHVIISQYSSPSEKEEIPGISKVLNRIDNIKISRLQNDLEKAKKIYTLKNSTRNFLQVISTSNQLLKALCVSQREDYAKECTTCSATNENETNVNNEDFFADIKKDLNDLKAKTKENENAEEKLNESVPIKVDRILYLTNECKDFSQSMLDFEPKYPDAICTINGKYAPKCIEALKAWPLYIKSKYAIENKDKKVKPTLTQDNTAFESF